jgi:hypothetical protein
VVRALREQGRAVTRVRGTLLESQHTQQEDLTTVEQFLTHEADLTKLVHEAFAGFSHALTELVPHAAAGVNEQA